WLAVGREPGKSDCRISSAYGPGTYRESKSPRFDDSFGSTRILSSPSSRPGTHRRRSASALVRYGPTTSTSGAAVTTGKVCDTTRIAGAAACGDPVGIGSGVRTRVVAVGSTVGAVVGASVALGALDAVDAVADAVPLGVAAGGARRKRDQRERQGQRPSHRRHH